ncbi:unnamed protein product [Ixodes hexagonus]
MWRLIISSKASGSADGNAQAACPAAEDLSHQDSDRSLSSRSNSPEPGPLGPSGQNSASPRASPLRITTCKVCTQELPLPQGVEIAHATPAAGHLSSSNIYPACFAPYLLSTACSDGLTRFWKCLVDRDGGKSPSYTWVEWEMTLNKASSAIQVPGMPLSVSCAYSGRVACAYKRGQSFTRSTANPADRFVNLGVAIYECESTGGSEWILEDTVLLNNVSLARMDQAAPGVDLAPLMDSTLRQRKTADTLVQRLTSDEDLSSSPAGSLQRLLAVPSYATLHTLRRAVIERGNQCPLVHKSLVQLDWVSSEDGSHLLTVAVGSRVLLFTPVSQDLIQQGGGSLEPRGLGPGGTRPLLKQMSSLGAPVAAAGAEAVRWLQIRCTKLETADGLPALPMQLSWVRDGILVVGMDSEMHIYSQWRPQKGAPKGMKGAHQAAAEEEDLCRVRMVPEEELLGRVQEMSQLRLGPGAPLGLARNASSSSSQALDKKKARADAAAAATRGAAAAKESETALGPMLDLGLFETSRLAWPVLPQYHPKQLMELLGFGKIRRVKAILSHLVRCVSKTGQAAGTGAGGAADGGVAEGAAEDEGGEDSMRGWSRSRTLSLAAPAPGASGTHSPKDGGNVVPEELQLDYVEIQSIPPLPLFALLAADKQTAQLSAPARMDVSPGADANEAATPQDKHDYSTLFESAPKKDKSLEDFLQEEDAQPKAKPPRDRHKAAPDKNPNHFGMRQARLLTQLLTHCHLPGLSSVDQMHLLALADTIASFHATLADRFDSEIVHTVPKESVRQNYEMDIQATPDSLDDCGLRYFLAVRHHTYLVRCLPLAQRAQLQRQGLGSHNLVWAFHSETQEELVQLIPSLQKPALRWAELRELGLGWWIRSNQLLRRIVEKLAKSSFQANSNPLDAALFYMALKKKNILAGLFRSVSDKRMSDFFQNNFLLDRWRKAALKNAYVLLGKQQFEHAAAFFLLAGSVKDAVQVCLNKLEDLQLAMVVVRLHEGDLDSTPEHLQRLLDVEVLGQPEGATCPSLSLAHPDPFFRSMALWLLQRYEDALTTLLQTHVGQQHHRSSAPVQPPSTPAAAPAGKGTVPNSCALPRDVRRAVRGRFLKQNVYRGGEKASQHYRLRHITRHGLISVHVVTLILSTILGSQYGLKPSGQFKTRTGEATTTLVTSAKRHRSKYRVNLAQEQCYCTITINMSANAAPPDPRHYQCLLSDASRSLNRAGVETHVLLRSFDTRWDRSTALSATAVTRGTMHTSPWPVAVNANTYLLVFSLLRIAFALIMMEELSTLATGFEVDGGQLRHQLYLWLERCVAALKELCQYGAAMAPTAGSSVSETSLQPDAVGEASSVESANRPPADSQPGSVAGGGPVPTLHAILVADKQDFEAKLVRAARRKLWLKANEALLRTLLSYTGLHGAHGGGLAAVRMELNLLLQELQQDRSQQQLLSPLPFPTTLPLLAASVACQKTVVADPVRLLQLMAQDILQTVVEFQEPPGAATSAVTFSRVSVLWDLGTSLSACIYQALCDSDSFGGRAQGTNRGLDVEDCLSLSVVYQNSHLLAGHAHRRPRLSTSEEPLTPTTLPSKWPGVQSWRALMARDKDEDGPRLHTLLCESFVAVFLSQLIHALASCDCHVLFRLVGQRITKQTWGMLFGGGAKKLLRVTMSGAGSSAGTPSMTAESE